MIRIGTVVWFVVLALLGIGLFQVKYAVQAKERELRTVNRQITADRQILRVLEAEWSYLNDPVRLADLTRRHTDLAPVMANQIATFDALRLRPADDSNPGSPLLANGQGPLAAIPAAASQAAVLPVPTAQPETDGNALFQTSGGAAATADPDEDATIRAILADMESKQNGVETTTPVPGGAGPE